MHILPMLNDAMYMQSWKEKKTEKVVKEAAKSTGGDHTLYEIHMPDPHWSLALMN